MVMASAITRAMPPAEMEARAGEVAALLKTLSHPARLRLACALAEAGVVATRREAKQIFYRLSEEKAARLIEALYAIYCEPEQHP